MSIYFINYNGLCKLVARNKFVFSLQNKRGFTASIGEKRRTSMPFSSSEKKLNTLSNSINYLIFKSEISLNLIFDKLAYWFD
ncbi:hypothetical protein CLV96_3983 [Leptospira meyeri]|uniref:Uncharacterized protein n=1 Tax=Leptospira meyeri TaxID=29508 RepID=A0A4R8MLF6_LEPME|nr:hypothetical protein CLV96_3983 [Leptospira meyeri]